MRQDKVVHVKIKDENADEREYYFGSIAAIYSVLQPQQLGIKLTSLQTALFNKRFYENKKIIVRVSKLIRSPHKQHL